MKLQMRNKDREMLEESIQNFKTSTVFKLINHSQIQYDKENEMYIVELNVERINHDKTSNTSKEN